MRCRDGARRPERDIVHASLNNVARRVFEPFARPAGIPDDEAIRGEAVLDIHAICGAVESAEVLGVDVMIGDAFAYLIVVFCLNSIPGTVAKFGSASA